MKRGIKLKDYEVVTVIEMRKYHQKAKVRERAHAIELLNSGMNRNEVSKIFKKHEDTISDWTVRYNKYGIDGLFDEDRAGRPREVTDEIRERILEITESPETCTKNSIKTAIESEFDVKFHPDTIKYYLKKRKVRLQKNKI